MTISRWTRLALPMLALACTSVDATDHCVQTRYGKIVKDKMDVGLTWAPLTEETCFSLTDQQYPSNAEGKEEIEAQTSDPVTISSDLSVTFAYDPARVTEVFREKRTPNAVEMEVLNAIRSGYRSAIASWSVADIFSPRRAYLDDSVRTHIQRKIGTRVVIKQVFVRDIRVPPAIEQARIISAKKTQELDAAKQQEAIAVANANATIAEARGEAEASKLKAQALASNPKMIDLQIAEHMSKICAGVQTCIIGGTTQDLLRVRGAP